MKINHLIRNTVSLIVVLGFLSAVAVAGPVYPGYQNPQGVGSTTTLSGTTGGTAGLTAWFWDGGNGYDYYAYQIVNTSLYHPYIERLSIANPTETQFWITGSAGSSEGGSAWTPTGWTTWVKDSVAWTATGSGVKVINPGDTSSTDPYFEFAVVQGLSRPGEVTVVVSQGTSATGTTMGVVPVPEPASLILLSSLASGLLGATGIRKRFFLRS